MIITYQDKSKYVCLCKLGWCKLSRVVIKLYKWKRGDCFLKKTMMHVFWSHICVDGRSSWQYASKYSVVHIWFFKPWIHFASLSRITCGCFCCKNCFLPIFLRERQVFLKCAYHSRVLEQNPFHFFIQTNHTWFHEIQKYAMIWFCRF